jgi:hypothetical protein
MDSKIESDNFDFLATKNRDEILCVIANDR